MPTQVQRTAAARRRLIAATRELVAAQGVGNTSVAAIGELAGMSRGAVNFHFGSKDDLLVSVVEQVTADWEGQTPPADGLVDAPQLDELLDLLLTAWLGELAHDSARVRIVVMLLFEALGPSPHLHDHFAALSVRLRGRVSAFLSAADRQHGSAPDDLDPDAFASLLLGLLTGIAVLHLLDPDASELDRVIAEARATLLARLQG